MSDLIAYDAGEGPLPDRMLSIFVAQPALRLTSSQLQRLLGSAPKETERVLDRLVARRTLTRSSDGYLSLATAPRSWPMPEIGADGRWRFNRG